MKTSWLGWLLPLLLCAGAAHAQDDNVTKVIVPFPAGGTLDVLARVVTQKIGEQTKSSYVVDNRPGANGMIGAKAAARAKPDGLNWLFADGAAIIINPFLYPPDPAFSAEKDLRPVRSIATQPMVLVVKKGIAAKSLSDFVALARAREITYASAGVGSSGHLTMSLLANVAPGLKLVHVPYKGGPQVTGALIAGEVDSGFVILPNVLQHVKRGDLTAIAVSSPQRSSYLPDVPTMIELGYPKFDVENRYFVWLPGATPDDVARRVDALLLPALAEPGVVERIRAAGLEPVNGMGEAESRKWLDVNRALWEKLIREANIRAE